MDALVVLRLSFQNDSEQQEETNTLADHPAPSLPDLPVSQSSMQVDSDQIRRSLRQSVNHPGNYAKKIQFKRLFAED